MTDLRLVILVGATLVCCATSCGGGLDRHAAYQRIQVSEARIAHALHGIEALEPDAATERCRAACEASDAIATEAAALSGAAADGLDEDAARRADQARRACEGCRAP